MIELKTHLDTTQILAVINKKKENTIKVYTTNGLKTYFDYSIGEVSSDLKKKETKNVDYYFSLDLINSITYINKLKNKMTLITLDKENHNESAYIDELGDGVFNGVDEYGTLYFDLVMETSDWDVLYDAMADELPEIADRLLIWAFNGFTGNK